jgi:hypothetical protein
LKPEPSDHEPLRATLVRTGLIALVVGVVAARIQRQPASWPQWTAFALWFSFGGHWVELFFLDWLRPRLAAVRSARVIGRLVTWLIGGTLLMVGARITAQSLGMQPMRLPPWWHGGPILVGIELVVHALPPLRWRPNFYNGLR